MLAVLKKLKMLSLIIRIKNKSNMSFKISKIFAIPLIFSSFLFDANNEFNKVNANVKSKSVML